MPKFTFEETLAALREVVAEAGPEHVNESCNYSDEEYEYETTEDVAVMDQDFFGEYGGHRTPRCIVGQVDYKLGIFGFEPPGDGVAPGKAWDDFYEPAAVRLLEAVQQRADARGAFTQDGYWPWGKAVEAAEAEIFEAE